jgi:hypothetical protein
VIKTGDKKIFYLHFRNKGSFGSTLNTQEDF